VLDLYDAVTAASDVQREPEFAPPRLGELQRSVLDPERAARELRWRARHGLDEGLRATWKWISDSG